MMLFVPFLILNTKIGELFRLFVQFFFFAREKKKKKKNPFGDVKITLFFLKFKLNMFLTLKYNAQKTHILFAQFDVVGAFFSVHCKM